MKLLIFSDLHFSETNDWDLIGDIQEKMVNHVQSKLIKGEELIIVVLGDIFDKCGSGNNKKKYDEACIFFDFLKSRFEETQFYFVPGNHELGELKTVEEKKGKFFTKLFSKKEQYSRLIPEFDQLIQNYNGGHPKFTDEESAFSIILEGLNLVFVDSTLNRVHNYDGKIDEELVKGKLRNDRKNFLFMHYPPCPIDGADREIENADKLLDSCQHLIFYGHQHGCAKIPDFLTGETYVHRVGALFLTAGEQKSEFLLLDLKESRINYLRRYQYVNKDFRSELLFPKRENILSQEKTFPVHSKSIPDHYLDRRWARVDKDNLSLFNFNELDILQSSNFIIMESQAGMGKSVSMLYLYQKTLSSLSFFSIWLDSSLTYETISQMLKYADKTIDHKTPLFFLDGFDEIPNKDKMKLKKEIHSLVSTNIELKFIISTRKSENLELDGFSKYTLLPLNKKVIVEFLKDVENTDFLLKKVEEKGGLSLLQTPFFTEALVRMYQRNNVVPNLTEISQHMINERIYDGDQRHKEKSAYVINDNVLPIKKIHKKVSFLITTTQEPSINNEHFCEIRGDVPSGAFTDIGLINKIHEQPNIYWNFDHKIFCEFFLAETLKALSLEQLLGVVAIEVEGDTLKKTIRPSFLNVFAILLDLRGSHDLLNWACEHCVEQLVEIQPETLSEEKRNEIFMTTFNQISSRNLYMSHEYQLESLVKYFDNDETFEFLKNKLTDENGQNKYLIINVLCVLKFSEKLKKNQDQFLEDSILSYLTHSNHEVVTLSIQLLTINSQKFIPQAIEILKTNATMEIKSAMYRWLGDENCVSPQLLEENVDYLLTELKNVTELEQSMRPTVVRDLFMVVKRLSKREHLLKALEIMSKIQLRYNSYELNSTVPILLNVLEVADCTSSEEEMLFSIFLHFSRNCATLPCKELKEHFVKNGLAEKALQFLFFNREKIGMLLLELEDLMSESLADKLSEIYRENLQSQNFNKSGEIQSYAERLPKGSPIFEKLSAVKEEVIGEKIPEREDKDYVNIREQGEQRYFNALFDADSYQQLWEELLPEYENVCCKDLLKGSLPDHERQDLQLMVTGWFHSSCPEVQVSDFMKAVDWEEFSFRQMLNRLSNYKSLKVSQKQRGILEEKYNELLQKFSFAKKSHKKEELTTAKDIVFLTKKFNFRLQEEKISELLYLPWTVFSSSSVSSESECLNFLEEYIKSQENTEELQELLKAAVLKNLANGKKEELSANALQTHIIYCIKHKISEALPLAYRLLQTQEPNSSFLQRSAIQYINQQEGEDAVDSRLTADTDDDLLKYAASQLITARSNLISILIQKNKDSEDKLLFLPELISLNTEYGLNTIIDLAKEKQCVPDKPLRGDIIPETVLAIRKIDDIGHLALLMELFLLSLSEPFVNDTQCHLFSYVHTALDRLILTDAEEVVKNLNSVLKEHDEKELVKSHCNRLIAQCENSIKIDYDKPLSWEEAVKLYEKLFKGEV